MSLPKIFTCSLFAVFCLAIIPTSSFAQEGPRLSLMASVSQHLGTDTDITIVYSRPGVKGRVIWGELVPYGLAPGNEYSEGKPYPWRAGANENTTFETTSDLIVEGQRLPAGKYGLHMIPSQTTWTIIFSNNNAEWGSFSYDESADALRVTVTPTTAPLQEWLMFGFDNLAGTSATAYLRWERLKVPFRISLAN
jgi:hypothetical protein